MRKIEKICFIVGGIGLLFWFLNYPFSSELLIISFDVLSVLYMFGSFFIYSNTSFRDVFKGGDL